jgi:hypothetical protein
MFHGAPDDLVTWFDHLGYKYDPAAHGVASDWALDLVAIGFQKPVQLYGHSITSMEQLQAASVQFVSNYKSMSGAVLYRGGSESMMIGTKSLKHRVRARMQKYSGVHPLPAAQQQPGLQVYVGAHSNTAGSINSSEAGSPQASSVIGDPVGGPLAGDAAGSPVSMLAADSVYATGWWRQLGACYGRELLAVTRNPADVAGRILTFTWVGILTGVLFYNLPGDASSLQRRLNLVYSNLAFLCLMPYISMSLYTADKKFYLAGGHSLRTGSCLQLDGRLGEGLFPMHVHGCCTLLTNTSLFSPEACTPEKLAHRTACQHRTQVMSLWHTWVQQE